MFRVLILIIILNLCLSLNIKISNLNKFYKNIPRKNLPSDIVMISTNKIILDIFLRIIYLSGGFFLGFVTILPNVMMSDSRSKQAKKATEIGLIASFLFPISGIISLLIGNPIFFLIPILIEILAFKIFSS
jgi:hypothetical protein